MKRLKDWGAYGVPILIALAIGIGYYYLGKQTMYLCDHTYALCTSARCIPQPDDPDRAICLCDVEEGTSMSTTSCDRLRPSMDAQGIRTVYSTFSYRQYGEGKKTMQCPGGTPWTWCLNKQCTVDPSDPKRAICLCDVVRSEDPWITLGGDCDPSTCKTAYWSGAGLKNFEAGNVFLTKNLKLEHSPVKWCPVD